jgi:hypothetical protein
MTSTDRRASASAVAPHQPGTLAVTSNPYCGNGNGPGGDGPALPTGGLGRRTGFWRRTGPLLDTYRQLQELRLYYDFHDVDVDRYTLSGTYQQVMLAARELNQSRLPADAQTWINQHFKFTHGFGLVMSPVNRFDEEGLPVFYVKDIPPASSVGLTLDRPQLYFGEEMPTYVVVRGGTTEFDYARGQENVYTTYHRRGSHHHPGRRIAPVRPSDPGRAQTTDDLGTRW